MTRPRTWHARAVNHWSKAQRASGGDLAYVHLLIAADCHDQAVQGDTIAAILQANRRRGASGHRRRPGDAN
ncbi:MAG: hypothetical protein L6R19_16670 [Alphaproteobacteria bacterium]|nr:hypothetical protein [Alphaproteobacteria bacterium]